MSTTATAGRPGAAAPARPRKPKPSPAVIGGVTITAAITVWAGWSIDFTLMPLFTDVTRGRHVIAEFFNPDWTFLTRAVVIESWLTTLFIAILATAVGCAIGLGMAMLASKTSAPNKATYQVSKAVLSVLRALPDVALGSLFAAIVLPGPLAGILALIVFNIGVIAKLTGETADAVDPGPIEAVEAGGGNRIQRARWAIYPQIAPNYLSYCFYVFELNLRASVVIGIVGGGGIGALISTLLGQFQHERLGAIIVSLFVVVFVLDQASRAVRRRLT